ncbi:MAG: DUF5106 domain-containing protein [Bacteroidales bacterium]|nr:DUF5106 domain-containing protein [Bacteroidales bacterium]
MKRLSILLLTAIFAVACVGGQKQKKSETTTVALQVPNPPAMMDDGSERAEYVLEHYWQNYKPEIDSVSLEQAFSNWVALTEYTSRAVAAKSLLSGYDKAPERILPLAEKYLYDPNSPYRDEDFYGALAAHIGTPEMLALAKVCALNPVGSKATDFVWEDARGRRHHLYEIQAGYTILFFSNPGCNACKGIIDEIAASQPIQAALNAGYVAVVNIYIDEDLDAWRDYLPNYPKTWHTGFDPLFTLRNDTIYHIRAIPSVYLLGPDMTVIMKDAPTERLIQYLEYSL